MVTKGEEEAEVEEVGEEEEPAFPHGWGEKKRKGEGEQGRECVVEEEMREGEEQMWEVEVVGTGVVVVVVEELMEDQG